MTDYRTVVTSDGQNVLHPPLVWLLRVMAGEYPGLKWTDHSGWATLSEAADEIERLRLQTEGLVEEYRELHKSWQHDADQIERLRSLGDRVWMHADAPYGSGNPAPDWVKKDLDAWKEARRGLA